MRPSLRVEIEEVFFESVVSEIYREIVRKLKAAEKAIDEDNKEREADEEPCEVDLEAIVDDVLDPERYDRGFPIGLEDFVDALDRAGWELRRRRLTSSKRSAKTRKPRIRRLAEV